MLPTYIHVNNSHIHCVWPASSWPDHDSLDYNSCSSLVCYGFNRDRVDQSTKFGTLIPWHI